jgi:signal transduction histidine kinase
MLLPYWTRVLIVLSLFLLCSLLLYFNFPSRFNASIFVIPTGLASWVFRPRFALAWLICAIISITAINGYNAGFTLSLLLAPDFFTGAFALIFVNLIVIYLRFSVERFYILQTQTQEAEKRHLEEYEQHIEALKATREVVFAYEQMQKINQLKDDFIANITHELRTPLTQVYGYLELLNEHHNTLDEAMREYFLHSATEGCHELVELINNALDALSITDTMPIMKLEFISLEEVVQETLGHIDPELKQGFTVQVSIPPTLVAWSDKAYLHRILENLLTNAYKYAPKSTTVHIKAVPWIQEKKGIAQHFVCVSVEDQGPGIPIDELPKLFGKFNRLRRDYSGSIRGSGLGLYICKQYVQSLGGEIWVDSPGIAGQGSCFRFTIPAEAPQLYIMDVHNPEIEASSVAQPSEKVM